MLIHLLHLYTLEILFKVAANVKMVALFPLAEREVRVTARKI